MASTPSNPQPKTWFITGATSGFGRAIAEAAISRGDIVVAAVRDPEKIREWVDSSDGRLHSVRLDITETDAIPVAVDEALRQCGHVDILVNNAGRSQVGAVEETTEEELRYVMDLHFFGPVALTKVLLPHMRSRGGAIVQMSSMGGQMSFAGFGAYSASKCALEGLSEALADEVAPFGIKVLIVEPGAFRTGLFGAAFYRSEAMDVYADTVGVTRANVEQGDGKQPGDPERAADAIIAALEAEETPLRLPLGNDAVDVLVAHSERFRSELSGWERIVRDVEFR